MIVEYKETGSHYACIVGCWNSTETPDSMAALPTALATTPATRSSIDFGIINSSHNASSDTNDAALLCAKAKRQQQSE